MGKKWLVRRENTSKIIKGEYIFLGDYGWVIEETKARVFKTKKDALRAADISSGEVYGK